MKLLNKVLSAAALSLAVTTVGFAQMDGMNMGGANSDPMASTSAPQAATTQPTAESVMAEIKATKLPQPDSTRTTDEAYMKGFMADRTAAIMHVADLFKQFADLSPAGPQKLGGLNQRWKILAQFGHSDTAVTEMVAFEKASPDLAAKGHVHALEIFYKAQDSTVAPADKIKMVDSLKGTPDDASRGEMLMALSSELPPQDKVAVFKEILADFPNTKQSASANEMLPGATKQADAMGKPFPELKFTDAITGKEISTTALKGKVVVLDFWATWCGPCKAEMPNMKKIYADFHDKGVEFIGVSLDQPDGLDALKGYVKDNDLQWPQYFQGNYWQSDFSKGWGIMAIPACFVIDADGNLFNTMARGHLEEMLPELIKKRDGAKSASAQ